MESTRTSTAGKLLRVLMAIVLSFWMVPVTHMDFAYADESAPGATQLTLGGGDNAPASQDAPAASAAPKGMGALGFAPMADGETVTIGTGANVPTSTSSHFPMACYYNNSVSEVIYLASEFVDSSSNQIANGTITSIAYHVGRANASSYSDLSIYMGYTDAATATSNITPTDPVLVYSNTNGRICSATGWETYELSTPFEYDSSRGNLIVVVIRNGSDCNSSSGYTVTSGTVSSRYYQNDSNSSSSLDVALGRLNNSDTNRPNTLFTIEAAGGPKFTTQPEGFAYQAGTANSTALTAVAESEDATFSYQWYKSSSADLKAEDLADTSKATAVGTQGTATTSEGSASVTYTPTAEDLGSTAGTVYFYCQATDSVGTSASKPAAVDVFTSAAQAPTNVTIASEPAATEGAVEANAGNAVALTASATAAETGDALYYQWFEKADGASDFTAIEGATEATYTTTAELNKTNTYRFEVWASHEVPTNTSEHVTSSEIAVTGKPITVSTEAELREIATNVNNGNSYEGMSITVTSDIELTSAWTPIGDTSAHAFKGTFDGDGHTISGLSIDTTSTYQGLFGYVNSATIKNLVVQGAVKSGSDSAGVVGYAAGATIENVGNEATVTAESAGNVGGVLGRGYSSTTVTACYNKGNVSGYNDNVGGIVGNGSNTSVTSCYNTGTVTMLRNSNNYYVGGIDGASAYVKNCVNAGTVSTVYASVDKGIGAIGGSSWQSISSADDACYYLDSSCAFAVNGAAQTNVNAVTAEQLSGAADYNGAPLLDALNTGAYADRWIAGGDQPSPKLFWEVVEGAPFITTHPASAEYAATDAIAALTCEAEYPEGSGSDTGLTYAWFKTTDRENAVGTGKTYTPTTQPGSSESFFCVVTNPNDGDPKTTTSKTATIKVLGDYAAETPVFSKPAEATAIEGKILTASALEAEVSVSKGDLTYQWYKATDATGAGAEAIEGATSTTYSFKPSDGGTYYFFCKATNTDEYARAGEQTATADSPVYTVTVGEYTISTPAELLAFKQSVNYSNTFEGVTVHLKADLDLQSDSTTQSWDPINNFAGTFDGEGHTIDGVQVSMTTSGAGLFGNTRVGVVIHDLIIGPNSSVTGTYNVGGIVGSTASSGTATIYNCGNHATVTATQANSSYSTNYSMAGGIVGGTYGTVNVTACYNKGAINGKTEGVGGIVGGVRSSSESDRYATVITSCYNAGTVTNENTSRSTGGISGYYTLIKNCLNFGSVPKGEASYNNYIGAIGGLRPQSVSATGNDVSYFLDTSSVNAVGCSVSSSSTSYADHTAAYYKKQTAAQLKAAAMVDTLNVGDYAGMWIAGGDSRTPQDYPALFWEEAGGMPTITQQPQSAEYDADATIEPLTVVAEKPEAGKTGSDGTLTYQWYKAPETGDPDPDVDEAIANATQASYTPALGADEVGRYYVAVTNTFGEKAPVAISDVAEVRVRGTHVAETPVFTTPTEAQTVSAMQPVATQIEAVATVDKGDLSYQWYKLDAADADKAAAEPIEGATESTFAPDTTELGTFYYFCRATNTDVSAKSGSQTATADSEVFTVEVKPLTISTEDELLAFSQLVNSGTTFAGATVELLADLDLGSDEDTQAWTPIGMSTSIAFKGTFEGNGHTITIDGMGVNSAGNAGLFGCVTDGAVIRNLTVDGEVTSADHNYLAAVCGYVQRG
ncbi:MAG: hypothetical protein IJ131_11450, partial [Eggerthellaceae bacterium]|nr:hypothetical protein [Eggerthellaceae bacterium]